MLAREFRFHGHGSLNYLHRNGRSVRHTLMLIKYVPNKYRGSVRASVSVGKKVSKKAVVRNRIRRRIYEVLRKNWDHIMSHNDFIVTVFSADVAVMPTDELERIVVRLLKQAKLYQPKS